MSETKPEKDKIDQVIELLEHRCDELQSYHNHKETMAHAALLLWLAMAGFVLTSEHWPPKWVPAIYISEKWVTFVAVGLVWFMIHSYMRWQLKRRRAAAQLHGCLLTILAKWTIEGPPSTEEIKLAAIKQIKSPAWTTLIDFLFSSEKAMVDMDVGMRMYPQAVVDAFPRVETAAVSGERIVTLASLLVLALIAAATLLRP